MPNMPEKPVEFLGELPMDQIQPSPTNPRKTFADIEGLAASIAEHGLLQRILVRPRGSPDGPPPRLVGKEWRNLDHFEIVAGERRFRALQHLNAATAPVAIRFLEDVEVLQVQAVENEQRADVRPSEQAAHYQRMRDAGLTVEQIAESIGKSPSVVRGTLLLARMPPALAAAVDSGEVSRSTAELICRVPGQVEREKLAVCVIHGLDIDRHDWDELDPHKPASTIPNWMKLDRQLSYRETKDLIKDLCVVELKGATFSRKALDLVASAGSCDACPKRAGNDPDLVADGVRADVCTDPSCFREKTVAAAAQLKRKAEESGRPVLDGKAAQDLFDWNGHLKYGTTYIDLADYCNQDPQAKPRTYQKLIGKEAAEHVVVAVDQHGQAHSLVPRLEAATLLQQKHKIKIDTSARSSASRGPKSASEKKEEAKRREESKVRSEVGREILRKIAHQAESLGHFHDGARGAALLGHLLGNAIETAWTDSLNEIMRANGLTGAKRAAEQRLAIEAHAKTLDNDGLYALLIQFLMLRDIFGYAGDRADDLLKALSIDRKAIEKKVREDLKEAKPEPAVAKSAARNKEAGKDAAVLVNRDTPLADLLRPGAHIPAAARALDAWDSTPTVGKLLDRVGSAAKSQSYASLLYGCLRAIPNLGAAAAHEIGDAIVDAGLTNGR